MVLDLAPARVFASGSHQRCVGLAHTGYIINMSSSVATHHACLMRRGMHRLHLELIVTVQPVQAIGKKIIRNPTHYTVLCLPAESCLMGFWCGKAVSPMQTSSPPT